MLRFMADREESCSASGWSAVNTSVETETGHFIVSQLLGFGMVCDVDVLKGPVHLQVYMQPGDKSLVSVCGLFCRISTVDRFIFGKVFGLIGNRTHTPLACLVEYPCIYRCGCNDLFQRT